MKQIIKKGSFLTLMFLLLGCLSLYADNDLITRQITIHLETSTKPFLFNEKIFDAAIYAGTPQQIQHWPGAETHYLMKEDLIAVCSPQLILKNFPEAVRINEFSYDLSPEQLIQLPLLQQTTRPSIWHE